MQEKNLRKRGLRKTDPKRQINKQTTSHWTFWGAKRIQIGEPQQTGLCLLVGLAWNLRSKEGIWLLLNEQHEEIPAAVPLGLKLSDWRPLIMHQTPTKPVVYQIIWH